MILPLLGRRIGDRSVGVKDFQKEAAYPSSMFPHSALTTSTCIEGVDSKTATVTRIKFQKINEIFPLFQIYLKIVSMNYLMK